MDVDEFKLSLAAKTPPSGLGELVQALWHEAKGDWGRAHAIVQAHKGKASARVHAYLHRKEGNLDNANYWYERAGRAMPKNSLEQEWETLVATLLRDASRQR